MSQKPLRIGVVCYPTYGGSGVVATELGKFMASSGHTVHFITYNQPVRLDILRENIYYHEVNVEDYPLFQYQPYELALSSKMVDTVLNEGIELLHVHYAIPHAYAAYMAREILKEKGVEIPIITTLHGTDITLVGKNPSYKPAVTFSINHSDKVTSVSESLRLETISSFPVRKDIEVIPNFTDLKSEPDDKGEMKANLAPKGEKLVTHVSNFRKVKRIDDVVHTFFGISQKIPAKLILIGDGPERQKAEDLGRSLGIVDRLIFLGRTPEVRRVLAVSDLFLLPSEKESFGLAALEAMAAGVPVVSSNAGGLPEINQHGKTGYLADIGDVDAMVRFSLEILSEDSVHQQFREAAFAQASKFSIDKIGQRYIELYRDALSRA